MAAAPPGAGHDLFLHWQIVSDSPVLGSSPIWQFTTRGLHHFQWNAFGATQEVGVPINVTLRAVDEFGRIVTNYGSAATLSAFTNLVTVLYAEDFEDGDTQGWSTCPEEYSVTVTNVPGCGGQYGLSVVGETLECDEGVHHSFWPGWIGLPGSVEFRVRASATNVTCGELAIIDEVGVYFGMWADGTMGLDYGLSPRIPFEAHRWYKIGVRITPEHVLQWYWDDGVWALRQWDRIWLDFYIDDQLKASRICLDYIYTGLPSPELVGIRNRDYTEVWCDDIKLSSFPVPFANPLQVSGPVQFTNGVWAGQVTAGQAAQELYLVADDGLQHVGTNSPIAVVPMGGPLWLTALPRSTDAVDLHWIGGTGLYQIQQAINLSSGGWQNVGESTTNRSATLPISGTHNFFRLQCLTNAP